MIVKATTIKQIRDIELHEYPIGLLDERKKNFIQDAFSSIVQKYMEDKNIQPTEEHFSDAVEWKTGVYIETIEQMEQNLKVLEKLLPENCFNLMYKILFQEHDFRI